MRPVLFRLSPSVMLITLAAAAHGATLGLDARNGSAGEGSLLVPVSLAAETAEAVAGLQFDVLFEPEALQFVALETGDSAGQAEKMAHSNLLSPGHLRVVIAGFNRNAMASGTVAQLEFLQVPAGGQAATLRMTGAVLSDPFGSPLSVAVAPDTLILDRDTAAVVVTDAGPEDTPASSYASLARYRAVVFALVVVGIVMLLGRKVPKKGRRH